MTQGMNKLLIEEGRTVNTDIWFKHLFPDAGA
jgi:hypothetical protein